jgi:hypothetical protein
MIDRNIENPGSRRYPLQPPDSRLASPDYNYQRVGGLVVIPGLLREMGGDPAARWSFGECT